MLSNPLFLNLAVAGRLRPHQLLLECDEEQEVRNLVLESYLDRTLAAQREYEPEVARRHLTWIARFLNGAEVSPFGLKTTDFTVFDLADLTPPDPPRRYRLFEALVLGLGSGVSLGLPWGFLGQLWAWGLSFGLPFGLVVGVLGWWPYERSAVSSRVTLVWPSTRQLRRDFLRRASRGLVLGLVLGLVFALGLGLVSRLYNAWAVRTTIIVVLGSDMLFVMLALGLPLGLALGLPLGLGLGLAFGLVEPRSVLLTSRTPKEASSRSLTAALVWLVFGLVVGLVVGLVLGLGAWLWWHYRLVYGLFYGLVFALASGLALGLIFGLNGGGWFVLLQKVAHRRLAQAGNLPPRLYDFLEWGIESKIFRPVGGGVRFRHNLIQQHLANTSEGGS